MGQYRLSIYIRWQFGIFVCYERDTLEISFPFIQILVATSSDASGFFFGGWSL